MAKQDYYSVLGVRRDASAKEVKQAYRKLARKYHPDVNPGDPAAEQKFKEISEAYSVLDNAESRKKYDRFGHQAFSGGFGAGNPFTSQQRRGHGAGNFQADDLRDLFGKQGGFAESFGSIFDDLFGGGQDRAQRDTPQNLNLEQTVDISFEDAVRGASIQLRLPRTDGSIDRVQVRIPPGVDTGSKIRVAGKGRTSRFGGARGDLLLTTHVQPHRHFTREGNDLICHLPVTLGEAMLGAKIDVPTIDGKISMTVPAGTQNGRTFRLRGKGVPDLKSGRQGDQLVKISVVLPQTLDERSQQLVSEFMQRNPLEPRSNTR
jgi:DnaJ-class molecular chaperone